MGAFAIPTNGNLDHNLEGAADLLGVGGDAYIRNAINNFTATVNRPGVTTGQIIAAAAELKIQMGAAKAYYDVISTLGDDTKRVIEGAIR